VQPHAWTRLEPYATAGIGTFTGSAVARANVGSTEIKQYQRDTNFATNFGAGVSYRLTPWLGLNADYRHFIVKAANVEHVNRLVTGVRVFFK
jgi:opacity protein-like surface antigen